MRRRQTALLIVFLLISGLSFASQTRPSAEVGSVNPDDTTGIGPPITDQDKDGIPDLHEELFSPIRNISYMGGIRQIQGLDPNNGSDNISDFDRDGLDALMEYCWPYSMDTCFDERRSLTGKPPDLTESGLREFLDPRVSDTDGDGLPDGYEVYMCMNEGVGFVNESYAWTCSAFDPLDPSDGFLDSDRCADYSLGCGDGFDVNSDGIIEPQEAYTNAEEYSYGSPTGWVTEIDGLRCFGTIGSLVDSACSDEDRGIKNLNSGWLGTDPLRNDSDDHYFSGGQLLTQNRRGDGIEDGWEVYFNLQPLNSSDGIVDTDLDGWDANRDGQTTPDTSVGTVEIGEAFSNLQEYQVHNDGGYGVRSGLKSVEHGVLEQSVRIFDQGSSPSLLHHDVVKIVPIQEREQLILGSRYGVSIMSPSGQSIEHFELPAGAQMKDLIHWDHPEDEHLIISTNLGIHTLRLDAAGLVDHNSLISSLVGPIHSIHPLNLGGSLMSVLAAGGVGQAWIVPIDVQGGIGSVEPVEELESLLSSINGSSILSAAHASVSGSSQVLYVGTTHGMIAWNTSDLQGGAPPYWIFDNVTAEQFVRPANPFNSSRSAIVNLLEIDGPRGPDGLITSEQTLWVGTEGGLHHFDLIEGSTSPQTSFSRDRMENTDLDQEGGNDIRSIWISQDEVIVGSAGGTWVLEGDYSKAFGVDSTHTRIPGAIQSVGLLESENITHLFASIEPGRFSNIVPIDPLSSDSDEDGMPDGWEYAYDLDPTDPYDRDLDRDNDGVRFNPSSGYVDKAWTNLDEYRYIATTSEGFNGTDPLNMDTDGDGLADGSEYWGWYFVETNFTCYYLNSDYICDESVGAAAENVYLSGWLGGGSGGGSDIPSDPSNVDSDGDGMPDGWEIENRRWIGTEFTGGNDWTLDPLNPDDADEDADGDGLSNLCEYNWQQTLDFARESGFPLHGESTEAAENWTAVDPNNIDSDGDTLPDGWEARYSCVWVATNAGINPMNGSDAFSNPDGDGYDVNRDGVIGPDEQFNNWMEYHIVDRILLSNQSSDGTPHYSNWITSLYDNSWTQGPTVSFGERASSVVEDMSMVDADKGSSDPLSSDTDGDGMPDGWEIWYSRWDSFEEEWTLNPVDGSDSSGDPDGDGMTNWEEYGSIRNQDNEISSIVSVPQFYLFVVGDIGTPQPWSSAGGNVSFGSFMSSEQYNLTGPTTDPNNPDTDNDGMLDGIELLFTSWNETNQEWTLNPLVSGDGGYDGDQDAVTDREELNLTSSNPINGGLAPPDAPKMWEEAESLDPNEATSRIYRILFGKEGRASIAIAQYDKWIDTGYAPPLLATLLGITDPNDQDTDRDGMLDGYEYWFTEWDLDENRWTMNPLTDTDINADSDNDSFDCDGDGVIDSEELFTNLREYESRSYGKFSQINNIDSGVTLRTFAQDSIDALMQEKGMSITEARDKLFEDFRSKDVKSSERVIRINSAYSDNFNLSLLGISDPTHPDSDGDGLSDGWEYCYAIYRNTQPVNAYRWTTNPVNSLDVNYDADEDGWFDRTSSKPVAIQGTWEQRLFTSGPINHQISPGNSYLWFTNWMEYDNGTNPILADSDGDSRVMIFNTIDDVTTYESDRNFTDGREVFKYGTNPKDNDTDGDMLPDWYEYSKGWNESNNNWSSYRQISVIWQEIGEDNWKPLTILTDGNGGLTIQRATLDWTWVTMDPTDASDSTDDPDNDGGWDCGGATCVYIRYNNFQEFFGITNASLSNAALVRQTPLLDCNGSPIEEWWQFRQYLLGLCLQNPTDLNYMRMNKVNNTDLLYAHVVDDKDVDYLQQSPEDNVDIVWGQWTDPWNRTFGDENHLPNIGNGEFVWGWYNLDIDGDQIADGTDPFSYDTDGDWLNDYFEIEDDLLDGIRGNGGSPIRYDNRSTS